MSNILVDMDGVIADWGGAYSKSLDAFGHEAKNIPRHHQQTTFNLHAGRTERELEIIGQVMVQQGFYFGLDPIPGAVEALNGMVDDGHDVRIVTSPWVANLTCASDKLNWIAKHYGGDWASRVVITTDKTLVHGDFLIDDKPEVNGKMTPTWEHVLFDQPYNQTIAGRQRITAWAGWESQVVGIR
jgi:5'-nucleotidase